ncbi:MAG: gamma-glutamyltransferase, partial [Pseudomonadota bacterium]
MERLAIIGAVAAGLAATGVLLNASNRLADRSGPAPQQTVGHPATATQDAPTGAATGATPEQRQAAPEAASGRQQKQAVLASRHMVVAAHPDAAAAGREILRQGGSAVDAAIATQLVLNLVEPQSSGIGGGAFMLLWDAKAERLTTIDARETAPAAAKPDRFLPADGSAPQWETTVHSGLSIGVPGLVRGLYLAHRRHGRLAWDALFAPAIKLAEDGFTVGPRLNLLLAGMGADAFGPTARALYFSPDGTPVAVGTRLRNPAFAQTLRAIASGGPEAFYTGPLAADLIARVRSAPNAPSDLTLEDLAGYRALVREPVCSLYRAYRVCGMGPPSSGALTIAQVLTLIEPLTRPGDPLAPAGVHAMAEAQKLAFADRGRFIADVD